MQMVQPITPRHRHQKLPRKKGKVDTYGWRNSAPTVATPANPADNPAPTAANATNQQATPTTNHPAGNPAMDQQQREANAALNQAQQERANPASFLSFKPIKY